MMIMIIIIILMVTVMMTLQRTTAPKRQDHDGLCGNAPRGVDDSQSTAPPALVFGFSREAVDGLLVR
jgi:hypothetical protein